MISSENFIQQTDNFVFNNLKCLRFETSLNHCTICSSICPEDAFEFKALRVSLNENSCTSCGICIGSCPSEALYLKDFDELGFLNTYKKDSHTPLSCQTKEIPCLALFNSRSFAALALANQGITCDISQCQECPKNSGGKTYENFYEEILKANNFLKEINSIYSVETTDNYTPLAKRDLLKRAVKKLERKEETKKEKESLRNLYLQKALNSEELEPSEISTSIVFNKTVNTTCTLCNECQDFCPTNALSIVNTQSTRELHFLSFRCIDCGNCEVICKPKAISKKKSVDITDFSQMRTTTLASGEKAICKECKCTFITTDKDQCCSRCRQIEDLPTGLFSLARDLH